MSLERTMEQKMSDTIKLEASSDFATEGKQFIARVTGRGSGRFPLEFDFLGTKSGKRGGTTTALIDEPGLYVVRDTGKRGATDTHLVVWEYGDGLSCDTISEEEAMRLAKTMNKEALISAGRAALTAHLAEAIAGHEARIAGGNLTVLINGRDVPRTERIEALKAEAAALQTADNPRSEALQTIRKLMAEHKITTDDIGGSL